MPVRPVMPMVQVVSRVVIPARCTGAGESGKGNS